MIHLYFAFGATTLSPTNDSHPLHGRARNIHKLKASKVVRENVLLHCSRPLGTNIKEMAVQPTFLTVSKASSSFAKLHSNCYFAKGLRFENLQKSFFRIGL